MPQGFAGVKRASQDLEARRSGGGGNTQSALWFRLGPGEETVVRFLEQDDDIHWAMMHEVPVEGRQWGRDVPCLDQEKDGTPCPGCERDLPRKFKGYINVLWEDAPVFKRDDSGRMVKEQDGKTPVVVGTKPQVAIWSSGIRLFEDLDEINANYRGLSSRPFKVKRTGQGFDTKYRVNPADPDGGAKPMTDSEQALADSKYDLNEYVRPGSYEDFEKELNGQQPERQGGGGNGQPQGRVNPFLRN